ncbi:exopolysaccharide biosynthesis polyprenyl glycosylphosphotransferase [Streptomyces sp. MMBL 11-3]|uniref:exopolysaccharide biosynthesis polyprenyl glycosylphosphotransferase n=1 Tax=Streptomyces sp. MMBL 11-3 TaxID=3382639 RepID=UPI0039B63796
MTADSTVPSPGGRPRLADLGFPPVSVIPPRGTADGFGLPGDRRPLARRASRLPLPGVDAGAALAGGLLALPLAHPLPLAVLVLAVLGLNAHASLHRAAPVPAVLDELPALCGRIAVGWCALAALLAAYSTEHALSARTLLLGCAAQSVVSCAGRAAVYGHRRRALLRRPRAALVVGRAAEAQRVASAVLRHPGCGVRPVGVVADEAAGPEGLPVLTTGEEVRRAIVQNGVQDVLAVGPAALAEQAALLRALGASGCTVWELDTDGPAHAPGSGRAERLAGFACRRLPAGRRYGTAGKRLLDVLASGALLLLAGPVLLVCAAVLRAADGPGVVFRQERIGKDGRPFTLLKFRTHRPVDAHEAATRWSVANEQEMRWFCRFLRRTSMDELLQLWNVFRGDMSLVGPRPERPYFVAQFSQTFPGYAARHRMRTGITGLAQIHGLRGDTSIEDRCRFDNAYIDDWSLWQDVCILLRTAALLVRPTGS